MELIYVTFPEGCATHRRLLVNGFTVILLLCLCACCHMARAQVRLEIEDAESIQQSHRMLMFFLPNIKTSSGHPILIHQATFHRSFAVIFAKNRQPLATLATRAGTSTWATMESSPSPRTRFGELGVYCFQLVPPQVMFGGLCALLVIEILIIYLIIGSQIKEFRTVLSQPAKRDGLSRDRLIYF